MLGDELSHGDQPCQRHKRQDQAEHEALAHAEPSSRVEMDALSRTTGWALYSSSWHQTRVSIPWSSDPPGNNCVTLGPHSGANALPRPTLLTIGAGRYYQLQTAPGKGTRATLP